MELLSTVTLVYVAILVLALAVSLITILGYLWRIGTVLRAIGDDLAVVRDRTESMGEPLQALEDVTEVANLKLKASAIDLANAGDEASILAKEPAA